MLRSHKAHSKLIVHLRDDIGEDLRSPPRVLPVPSLPLAPGQLAPRGDDVRKADFRALQPVFIQLQALGLRTTSDRVVDYIRERIADARARKGRMRIQKTARNRLARVSASNAPTACSATPRPKSTVSAETKPLVARIAMTGSQSQRGSIRRISFRMEPIATKQQTLLRSAMLSDQRWLPLLGLIQ
jgi:hypothetical protein